MIQIPPRASDSNTALRRFHRGALAALGIFALVIAVTDAAPTGEPQTVPDRPFTVTAIGVAVASILCRRAGTSPKASLRSRFLLTAASLVLAAGIGAIGLLLVTSGIPRSTGLLYALAGALLCVRPPAPLPESPGDDQTASR